MIQGQQRNPGRTTGDGGATVEQLRSDISELAATVQKLGSEQFGAVAEQARSQAVQRVAELEHTIRDKPVQAATVSAALGFVIGLLMFRR